MSALGQKMSCFMDKWLLRFIEADYVMDDTERQQSNERSNRHEAEFQDFKARMLLKNGLDGGPSPAVIFDEPFVFEGMREL